MASVPSAGSAWARTKPWLVHTSIRPPTECVPAALLFVASRCVLAPHGLTLACPCVCVCVCVNTTGVPRLHRPRSHCRAGAAARVTEGPHCAVEVGGDVVSGRRAGTQGGGVVASPVPGGRLPRRAAVAAGLTDAPAGRRVGAGGGQEAALHRRTAPCPAIRRDGRCRCRQ